MAEWLAGWLADTHTGRAPRETQAAQGPCQEANPVRLISIHPSVQHPSIHDLPPDRAELTHPLHSLQVHSPIRQCHHDGWQEEDEPQPRNLSPVRSVLLCSPTVHGLRRGGGKGVKGREERENMWDGGIIESIGLYHRELKN